MRARGAREAPNAVAVVFIKALHFRGVEPEQPLFIELVHVMSVSESELSPCCSRRRLVSGSGSGSGPGFGSGSANLQVRSWAWTASNPPL